MAEFIWGVLKQWADNFVHNTTSTYDKMAAKDYIRLVIIIGSYLLLRPHLLALGAKMQARAHEKDAVESTDAEIHPNELRGGKSKIAIPGVDESTDEETEAKPGDWGKKARVRQRKYIRTVLEKEEARLADEQAAESDKEIEQYLVG